MERERTVMPRTTPSCLITCIPSICRVVVTIALSTVLVSFHIVRTIGHRGISGRRSTPDARPEREPQQRQQRQRRSTQRYRTAPHPGARPELHADHLLSGTDL